MHPAPALGSQHAAQTRWRATGRHGWTGAEFGLLPRPEFVAALAAPLCARRPVRVVRSSKSATVELLVDADAHSIDEIKEAIQLLEKQRGPVRARVFAPPGRSQNKKWARFLKEPGVSFEQVGRLSDEQREPNDDALHRAIAKTCRADIRCLALLTSDVGFVEGLCDVQARGCAVVALVPRKNHRASKAYGSAGLTVLGVGEERTGRPRVRAILLEDGTGSVEMAEAAPLIDPAELQARYDAVTSFLGRSKDQGGEAFYLVQLCVKFWFANSLGRLVVFPSDFASLAVHDLIKSAQMRSWKNSSESLAYFLPRAQVGSATVTNAQRRTFGSALARGVLMGGGPFVLQDSADMVERALRRLGYLDDTLNTELQEALFSFLNNSSNKYTLRKLAMLPTSGDTSQMVLEALRAAFLSNRSQGQWFVARPGPKPFLLHALKSEGLTNPESSASCSPEEMFEAMKVYARRHGLPAMRTFNGLVRRIQDHVEVNPSKRSLIEIGV